MFGRLNDDDDEDDDDVDDRFVVVDVEVVAADVFTFRPEIWDGTKKAEATPVCLAAAAAPSIIVVVAAVTAASTITQTTMHLFR